MKNSENYTFSYPRSLGENLEWKEESENVHLMR